MHLELKEVSSRCNETLTSPIRAAWRGGYREIQTDPGEESCREGYFKERRGIPEVADRNRGPFDRVRTVAPFATAYVCTGGANKYTHTRLYSMPIDDTHGFKIRD